MGQSPPFIGLFIGQRQTSTGQGQARKVGAVASFGVTFGSLVEADLGSIGVTGSYKSVIWLPIRGRLGRVVGVGVGLVGWVGLGC